MLFKESRELKVYEGSDRNYKPIPQIRLQGKWLEKLGFDIGTSLNVECRNGQLTITPQKETTT
jgi:toxic protein SymE